MFGRTLHCHQTHDKHIENLIEFVLFLLLGGGGEQSSNSHIVSSMT